MTAPRLYCEDSGCHISLMSVGEVLAMESWGGALGTAGGNENRDTDLSVDSHSSQTLQICAVAGQL